MQPSAWHYDEPGYSFKLFYDRAYSTHIVSMRSIIYTNIPPCVFRIGDKCTIYTILDGPKKTVTRIHH